MELLITLTHDRLTVAVRHEIRNLLFHGINTACAAALGKAMLPHVLRVVVVTTVGVVTRVGVERAVSGRLGVSVGVLGSSLREPLVVAVVARGSRHSVVWGAIARVGRSERGSP